MSKNFSNWICEYDLFFFDFDGLLVNTESLHYQAYQKMCSNRGFLLSWDFATYCNKAHMGSDFLQKAIYEMFPALYQKEPEWSVLYKEKQKAVLEILSKKEVLLMPGVEKVLRFLKSNSIRCCVVTHSPKELTEIVKEQNPILQTIPYWVTREQYVLSKPHPDPYLTALKLYAKSEDRVLGFEDTIRGWKSLEAASITGIIVSPLLTLEMQKYLQERKVSCFSSFENILS